MRCIDQLNIEEKRVLLRVDFNVPLEGGSIADDSRIRAALPTIRYALDRGSKLIIVSHLDRPGGKVVPELSLAPVAGRLSELLGREVTFIEEGFGKRVEEEVHGMPPGSAVMLENLRFDPGEEENSETLARQLASYTDVYVDDAFANAHRRHASNVGVIGFVGESAGGFLMRDELGALRRLLTDPERPMVAVIGGVKVTTKLGVLSNLVRRVDKLLLGGAMALTFLKAQGIEVGSSLISRESLGDAFELLGTAKEEGVEIILPVDFVVATERNEEAETAVVPANGIEPGWMALDIGPRTIDLFASKLRGAGTILWNGPMGVFELEPFRKGTYAVAEAIAQSTAYSVVGGGDTNLALKRSGHIDDVSYVSTGGGAFLEMLAGKELPAVEALEEAERRSRVPVPV